MRRRVISCLCPAARPLYVLRDGSAEAPVPTKRKRASHSISGVSGERQAESASITLCSQQLYPDAADDDRLMLDYPPPRLGDPHTGSAASVEMRPGAQLAVLANPGCRWRPRPKSLPRGHAGVP